MDKRTAPELGWPWLDVRQLEGALVPKTGGWHHRLYNGTRLRDSIPGVWSSI